ncbi:MAG: hypothetical protein KF690_11045 [Bacteroidetes bacterium]|nr:hypothetical protein [Bacteroidota bacterium]
MPTLVEFIILLGSTTGLPYQYRFCRDSGFDRLYVERIPIPAHTAVCGISFKLPEYAKQIHTVAAYVSRGTPEPGEVSAGLLTLEIDRKIPVNGAVPYGGPLPTLHSGGPANAWWEVECPVCNPLVNGQFRQHLPASQPFYLYLVFDTGERPPKPHITFPEFIQSQIQ